MTDLLEASRQICGNEAILAKTKGDLDHLVILNDHQKIQGFVDEERHEYVSRKIWNIVEYYIMSLASLVIYGITALVISNFYGLALKLGILSWLILYLARAGSLIKIYLKIQESNKKISIAKSIMSICLIILFIVFSSIMGLNRQCYSNIFTLSGLLSLSFLLNFIYCNNSTNSCYSLLRIVKIAISFLRLLTVFMILLKFDLMINLNWVAIFW